MSIACDFVGSARSQVAHGMLIIPSDFGKRLKLDIALDIAGCICGFSLKC